MDFFPLSWSFLWFSSAFLQKTDCLWRWSTFMIKIRFALEILFSVIEETTQLTFNYFSVLYFYFQEPFSENGCWQIWIVRWWNGQLFRIRLRPIFGVRRDIQLTSICWIENKFLEFVFCRCHWLRFYVFNTEYCQNLSLILLGLAVNVFEYLQHISHIREWK